MIWSLSSSLINILTNSPLHFLAHFMSRRIAKAANEFNEQSKDKEWIAEVERLGILPSPATASSIATFLYSTPKLDKTKIGLYLSKGPKDKVSISWYIDHLPPCMYGLNTATKMLCTWYLFFCKGYRSGISCILHYFWTMKTLPPLSLFLPSYTMTIHELHLVYSSIHFIVRC